MVAGTDSWETGQIWVSEIFTVLIFTIGESGTCRLASGMTKS